MRARTTFLAAIPLLFAALPTQAAHIIGTISVSGAVRPVGSSDMSTATGLDFFDIFSPATTGPGVPGTVTTAVGTGTFASLACLACGTIQDLPNFSVGPIANFIQLNSGIAFDLLSISAVQQSALPSPNMTLYALGTLRYAGFQDTAARLTLTTQGIGPTTFSSIALSAVPEPASWALMIAGFGLLGGALRTTRRTIRIGYTRS